MLSQWLTILFCIWHRAKDKFNQWNSEMWSIICEFFWQSSDKHQKCWFKHVHWFDWISYNYQCYKAFFLLMMKKNCGSVLLTDKIKLEKICLMISQWFLRHLCKLCWQRCCCKDYDDDDCTCHNQYNDNN